MRIRFQRGSEGALVFSEETLFYFGESQLGREPGHSCQGGVFSESQVPATLGPVFVSSGIWGNEKDTESHKNLRYKKYGHVMFDMDPFGGKQVPCTKYQ